MCASRRGSSSAATGHEAALEGRREKRCAAGRGKRGLVPLASGAMGGDDRWAGAPSRQGSADDAWAHAVTDQDWRESEWIPEY